MSQKRPEKKEYKIGDDPRYEGYNQAYDEWENWIEDKREEIILIKIKFMSLESRVSQLEEIVRGYESKSTIPEM